MKEKQNWNEKPLVLVVDDQPRNLKLISSVLGEKYALSVANNGANAMRILGNIRPDLILMDVMMPEMDGFEVCAKVKSNPEWADIPLVFLTAKTNVTDIIKGFDHGAVDYVTKPFNTKELEIRVGNHLKLATAMKELSCTNAKLLESEARLSESNRELERSMKEKNKFFSIIAHDLKGPLHNLIQFWDILNGDKGLISDEEKEEILEELYLSTKNLSVLLENLLKWSRMQMGTIRFNPEEVRPKALVENAFTLYSNQILAKSIDFHIDIPDELVIRADRMMLDTIFRNLISNALKFNHVCGTVWVGAKESGGSTTFSVRDNGMGIDEQLLPKLFGIGENIIRLGTANEMGSGLGLTLCKEFVEKQGGKIWVESESGKGAVFYFDIPSGSIRSSYFKEK